MILPLWMVLCCIFERSRARGKLVDVVDGRNMLTTRFSCWFELRELGSCSLGGDVMIFGASYPTTKYRTPPLPTGRSVFNQIYPLQ